MKGVIVTCLEELVKEKFGSEEWGLILEQTGLSRNTHFLPTGDIEDGIFMKIIDSTCHILNISRNTITILFGEYWVTVFAPRIYSIYFKKIKSSKDFFLKLDHIHTLITSNIPNAHPPRFEYEWKDDKTLLMTYKSHRDLFDFFIGLAKGIGKYFQEDFQIERMEKNKAKIVFLE